MMVLYCTRGREGAAIESEEPQLGHCNTTRQGRALGIRAQHSKSLLNRPKNGQAMSPHIKVQHLHTYTCAMHNIFAIIGYMTQRFQ